MYKQKKQLEPIDCKNEVLMIKEGLRGYPANPVKIERFSKLEIKLAKRSSNKLLGIQNEFFKNLQGTKLPLEVCQTLYKHK